MNEFIETVTIRLKDYEKLNKRIAELEQRADLTAMAIEFFYQKTDQQFILDYEKARDEKAFFKARSAIIKGNL
jgi:hypothetical protein